MANPNTGTAQPYYGQPVNPGTFANFNGTTGGVTVKSGEGVLYSLTINTPTAAGVITLYDGTSTGGTVIGVITVQTNPMPVTLKYNVYFKTGLFVVIATQNEDITISYK